MREISTSKKILDALREKGLLTPEAYAKATTLFSAPPSLDALFDDEQAPPPIEHAGGTHKLVALSPDHPGFSDTDYRERRNTIAALGLAYKSGSEIPHAHYTETEHAVWSQIRAKLDPLHDRLVCRELNALKSLIALPTDRIPQLQEVSETLERLAGFRMEPVAGLVNPRTFLSYLGRRVFLSTQYIRHHSKPLYTPEPDIVHELVGHAASLAHPGIAEVNRLFGRAAEQATDTEVTRLERVYWYTFEFGLTRENGEIKAVGAGHLSSIEELEGFQTNPALGPWDLDLIARTDYDPTRLQETLFVSPSFTHMLADVSCWMRQQRWRDAHA